jgi:hypothetical protein
VCGGEGVIHLLQNLLLSNLIKGARGSVVLKALCYKLEGRGFEAS